MWRPWFPEENNSVPDSEEINEEEAFLFSKDEPVARTEKQNTHFNQLMLKHLCKCIEYKKTTLSMCKYEHM